MQRGLWILLICLALFAGSLSQESSGDGDDDIDDNNEFDENEEDDGEEEKEDENGSGGVRLDETPCQDEIDSLKASHQDDGYMPACTSDGHFKPRQCYESSCWCVNDEGNELKESRHNHDIDLDCNDEDIFIEPDVSVEEHASKSLEEKNYASAHPAVLAVIIGSIIASLVCAVLVVMFIVYRMKKKDEGSYILGGAERRNSRSVIYTKAPGKEQEFYA
jgi:hypothetical protein